MIDPVRHWLGSVRLDGDFESCVVQGIDEWLVELEERLAARADDEWSHTTAGAARGSSGRLPGWSAGISQVRPPRADRRGAPHRIARAAAHGTEPDEGGVGHPGL